MWRVLDHRKTCDQAEPDDCGEPYQRDGNCDAIEIALGNARGTQPGSDSATKHVGEAAAATLVQQNEQGEQQARDHQDDDQCDLQNEHRMPFTGFGRSGPAFSIPGLY